VSWLLKDLQTQTQCPMISVKKLLAGKKRNVTYSLRPDNTVIEALELMAMANIGAVMIMDGGKLVGIFSERDYARKGIIQGRKAKSTPLTDVMIHDVHTVTPDMDIEDCMQLFTDKFIRHLPVVENEKVIGMLSIGDIVSAIMKEQTDHIDFLEKYITGG
jgi:CBS domain-containing protein